MKVEMETNDVPWAFLSHQVGNCLTVSLSQFNLIKTDNSFRNKCLPTPFFSLSLAKVKSSLIDVLNTTMKDDVLIKY